jgi:hypothetical protein
VNALFLVEGFYTMNSHNLPHKGRILTIEHPTESVPALLVLSGNAGQLLRGDLPTLHILQAMKQRTRRNGVPFVLHLQEAGAVNGHSVGMTRLLEDVFEDEVTLFRYGTAESQGQIRNGFDQFIISSKSLPVRRRSVVLLPVVERNILRRNQRAAVNTSYDFCLPDGEQGYLETTGFHYDLGLTALSKRVSKLQAQKTREGVEKLLQQDIDQAADAEQPDIQSIRGRKGFITFSGDGNTRGFVGTHWQLDRVESLKKGLGADIKEATEEIDVTANLAQSIQQEFIEKQHPLLKFTGNIINDVIKVIDDTTGNKWSERKLDHQFYREFTITAEGTSAPLQNFDVIENNVFYDFANADHFFIGTLFGYQPENDPQGMRR